MMAMFVGIVLFTIAIFAIVIFVNRYKLGLSSRQSAAETAVETVEDEDALSEFVSGETRTAEDLDIWNMYPIEAETTAENDALPAEETTPKDPAGTAGKPGEGDPAQPGDDDEIMNAPENDGKHTLVTLRDGSQEWVTINNYLKKSEIDVTKLVKSGDVLTYAPEGEVTSYVGIDVSKYNDYIDFQDVKNDGVQFVMIRVGARGYESGKITIDDYFETNLKRASDAGLEIGLYFYSQAVTTDEAIEEANTVLEGIGDYDVTYPIAIDMEFVEGDTSRTEVLIPDTRTEIVNAFCDTIAEDGYIPMIYGDKEWLIKEVLLTKLQDYDIWLAQTGDTPDYPYRFTMWQYATDGKVDGISGTVDMNISFLDFSVK